jgi:hypothetical protein
MQTISTNLRKLSYYSVHKMVPWFYENTKKNPPNVMSRDYLANVLAKKPLLP